MTMLVKIEKAWLTFWFLCYEREFIEWQSISCYQV